MLKFPRLDITMSKFYNIGVWCFGILALMNTITFVSNIINGNFPYWSAAVGAAVSLIFNYAIFGFFNHLRSNLPPDNLEKGTIADMEALVNDSPTR